MEPTEQVKGKTIVVCVLSVLYLVAYFGLWIAFGPFILKVVALDIAGKVGDLGVGVVLAPVLIVSQGFVCVGILLVMVGRNLPRWYRIALLVPPSASFLGAVVLWALSIARDHHLWHLL
jgi:hypothetical protein